MQMKLKRMVYWVLKGLAALVALVCTAFLLLAWFGHPKFSTDNIFIRPAGTGVFKMSDIPRGRALTAQQIDQYAERLLAEMTLTEKGSSDVRRHVVVGMGQAGDRGKVEIQRQPDFGWP